MHGARTLLAAAAGLLSIAPLAAQTPARLPEAAIDSIVRRAMGAPIAGLSVAVSRGDRVLLRRGYGRAAVEGDRPATAETVFEIGSITKQFTAAAVLRLAEEGRLRLDDHVGVHLPALRGRAPGVTLRHLLSHTSGLSSKWAVADLTLPASPAAVADSLAARPAEFAPGERFRYNNNGFILLGLVVEAVAGQPYAEHVRARFLRPLGLASTGPCADFPAARRARGYEHPTRGPGGAAPAPAHHPTVTFAAGSLCSTAADLLRWERALAGGRAVRPESFRQMSAPTPLASGRTAPYGLGMEVGTLDGRAAVGHGGALPGFVGQVVYDAQEGLGVAVLTNGVYAGAIVDAAARDIARAVLGMPRTAVADLPMAAEERARYTGSFDLGPARVEVYEQGDHLRAQPPGQVAARLLHQGGGVFRAEHDPSLTLRFRVEDGRARELLIEAGGRSMPPARRVP